MHWACLKYAQNMDGDNFQFEISGYAAYFFMCQPARASALYL